MNPMDKNLFNAAERGDTKAVKLQLDRGANIEARDEWGHTPLMVAIESGHIDTVMLLLDRGANMNAVSNNGQLVAQFAGKSAIVDLLEARGCKIPRSKEDFI
jgi:ankyrin repeat protein